jgi:hypothetical protein
MDWMLAVSFVTRLNTFFCLCDAFLLVVLVLPLNDSDDLGITFFVSGVGGANLSKNIKSNLQKNNQHKQPW